MRDCFSIVEIRMLVENTNASPEFGLIGALLSY